MLINYALLKILTSEEDINGETVIGNTISQSFVTFEDIGYLPILNMDTNTRNNLLNVPTGAIIFNTSTGKWQGYIDSLGWYDFTITSAP